MVVWNFFHILIFFILKLKDTPSSNKSDLRHKWFTLRRMNKQFKKAVQNCSTGKNDIDCSQKDYISSKEDFKEYVDSDGMTGEDLDSQYEAFVRSDFNFLL